MIQAYFRSGWAFLIPYLAAYLLYAWLKWPVNPALAGAGSMEQGARSWVPCLLHVYWALHVVHVVFGIIALHAWWRRDGEERGAKSEAQELDVRPWFTDHRLPETVYRLLPWVCLALIFWIPGIYLEWPSDPWEHLRRINEWQFLDTGLAHSTWNKSGYFFAYSLTGNFTGPAQLTWLNVYCTGICTLLAWQYYLLAEAAGLNRRWAFVSVLVNTLVLGNSAFSFYTYYGLSSTILSQLGAVAFIRMALKIAKRSIGKEEKGHERQLFQVRLPALGLFLFQGATACAIVTLIFFNHIQGLGIAGLGILAVLIWRMLEWKRSACGWFLAAAALVLSIAAILWWPRHPLIDSFCRPQGWLNTWYAFNLLTWPSPAVDRMLDIFGLLGLFNLVAGLILLIRSNHVVGWFTLSPVIALSLPFVALPYANTIADSIPVYHRMFLAVPAGLATIVLLVQEFPAAWWPSLSLGSVRGGLRLLPGLLLLLLLPSPGKPFYNRTWNALGRRPADLSLRPVIQDIATLGPWGLNRGLGLEFSSCEPIDFVFGSLGDPRPAMPDNRRITSSPIQLPAERTNHYLVSLVPVPHGSMTYLPNALAITTPGSMSASLTQHWLPQEVALSWVGVAEIERQLRASGSLAESDVVRLPSGGRILVKRHPPDYILTVGADLRLEYHAQRKNSGARVNHQGWLPFRHEQPAYLVGTSVPGGPRYSSGEGCYKFMLNLQPMAGGADVLLSIATLPTQDAIYLIHHRSGHRFYYYVGRNEIGPWSVPAAMQGSPLRIDFSWSDGRQILTVNGIEALRSKLPIPSELVTKILIGGEPGRPDRSLHGDILIEQFKLKSLPTR